jgi:hypothetical protein
MDSYLLGRNFAEDSYTAVRTDGGAQSAAGAVMLGIKQEDRPVPFAVQLICQGQNIGWAGVAAQLTALATLCVDDDSAFGHKALPP